MGHIVPTSQPLNLRNFGSPVHYTEDQADRKMSRRFTSINLAKPMEMVEQYPFVLCAWPSFADQPYITNYRIYDDRVGETTRFTHRRDHEWYWFPQQKPNEVSMLKCYDSLTDGSVSRWSFLTACIHPTVMDGIVLSFYIRKLWEEGHPFAESIIVGSDRRLRATMMTDLVAALGLLPAALSTRIGAQTQRPLAIVVIGGALAVMILTRLLLRC